MKFILGLKVGMSQVFDEKGNIVPVTLIKAGPCKVTQIKTKEKDTYESLQLGFQKLKDKKIRKTTAKKPFKYIKEFRSNDLSGYNLGDEVTVSSFQEGENVKVSGTSKGKGFAGAVKKWGFSGRNATHGVKHEHRTIGSVGSSFPQRVAKGRKMPGRMGSDKTTVKNLKIMKVDPTNNLLVVKGAIPGRNGSLLEIRA